MAVATTTKERGRCDNHHKQLAREEPPGRAGPPTPPGWARPAKAFGDYVTGRGVWHNVWVTIVPWSATPSLAR